MFVLFVFKGEFFGSKFVIGIVVFGIGDENVGNGFVWEFDEIVYIIMYKIN